MKNRQPSWFTNKVERLYWEQWYINLNVAQHAKAHSSKSHHSKVVFDPGGTIPIVHWNKDLQVLHSSWDKLISFFLILLRAESAAEERSARRAALEASLREVLFQIIKFVNEKKDHVPPIPTLEGVVCFPYEITIPRWVIFSSHLILVVSISI